jgi:hypothetical protein
MLVAATVMRLRSVHEIPSPIFPLDEPIGYVEAVAGVGTDVAGLSARGAATDVADSRADCAGHVIIARTVTSAKERS